MNPRLRWAIFIYNKQYGLYNFTTFNKDEFSARGNAFWFSRINQLKNNFSMMFSFYTGLTITFQLMTDQVWCIALLMYIIVLNRWHGSCWLWCLHPIPTVADLFSLVSCFFHLSNIAFEYLIEQHLMCIVLILGNQLQT